MQRLIAELGFVEAGREQIADGHGACVRIADVVHEADVVAGGEPFGFGGDRAEQVATTARFRLGVIAEHMGGDPVLVAGVADADADAAEIGAEEASIERRPLWPAVPPPCFTFTLNGARSSSSWNTVSASRSSL